MERLRLLLAIALLAAKRTKQAHAVANKVAPALQAPAIAESRIDFVGAFPGLATTTRGP